MGWVRPGHYLLAGLTLAGTALAGAGLVRRLGIPVSRVEVRGDSMCPTLAPGDRLMIVRTRRFRPGHLVALADPRVPERLVVKRVSAATEAGVTVLGDNAGASTDSRHYGPVTLGSVRGRAVFRYSPEGRRGRL